MEPKQQIPETVRQFLDPGFLDLEELLDALGHEVVATSGLLGRAGLQLRECPPERRKVALAISGGGAAGAYSAGLLEVLLERMAARGIKADLLVGTSSGAINGYGVFLEALGMTNPQFQTEPAVRQPYSSFIASVWSYLAREGRASRWVVGRRSWIVRLASRGLGGPWIVAGLTLATLCALALVQPNLLLPLAVELWKRGAAWIPGVASDSLAGALPFLFGYAVATSLALGCGAWLAWRTFRASLFEDSVLLSLLANTGPSGDLRRRRTIPKRQVADRASVLSRDIVRAWYGRMDEAPEFIVTGTNISSRQECLFTLVRPATYARLLRAEWQAVQLDIDADQERPFRAMRGTLLTRSSTLLQALVASSAVPGAFPTQRVHVYEPGSSSVAKHHFVDGGVLNNSPVHIALDAGATHVISLEILPIGASHRTPGKARGRTGYLLLGAALATLRTILERATMLDIRRTASWNRFLVDHPRAIGSPRRPGEPAEGRRIVPVYRIAPREPLVGTVEFDGHFQEGVRKLSLRDLLRRGVLDMRGRNVWAATVRPDPEWRDPSRRFGPQASDWGPEAEETSQ